MDLTLTDREASTGQSSAVDPNDDQAQEEDAQEVGFGQEDKQDQAEVGQEAKLVQNDGHVQEEGVQEVRLGQADEQDQKEAAELVEMKTAEDQQPNNNSHRQPDQDDGRDSEGDKKEESGAPGSHTLENAFASGADGVYENLWDDEYSAASIEMARGNDHPISEELGDDEGKTALLHTEEENSYLALSPPRQFDTPILTINSYSSPIHNGQATTCGKRPLTGGPHQDTATSPAKRTRVGHLGRSGSGSGSGSSHNPWDFAAATRDRGSVSDDRRLATNQCLTDSIVNVMCEFAAAHLPRAHFISSLTLSAAARGAFKDPINSGQAKAAGHKVPEVQDISRLITVAHKPLRDGDSSAGGHYVWVMADTVHRVVYTADSLAARAPGMSKDMSRVALAGINLLYPPPAPSPFSSVPPWSVQSLDCPQQINDVDCGIYTIVTCLRVAAAGPKKSLARAGYEEGKEPTAPLRESLPACCNNMLLWRAIILAMLRNARLWPILGELKVTLGVGDDDPLLQTQEDFRIPAKTTTRTSFDLLQRELDRVRGIRTQCATRSRALQSVLDDLDAAVEQVLEPLQRRWRACKLDAELKIRKLEGARARIEQAMQLTDAATLGISTPSLAPARAGLAGVLDELRLLRSRQVHVSAALTHGHERLRALELGSCRKMLADAVARYTDAA